MKKLTKLLAASTLAVCALAATSMAGATGYRSNILLFNAHKNFASSTKSSGTNNRATNQLYSSTPRAMRMWVDSKTNGKWAQVTSSMDFNPGNTRTYVYWSTPRSGAAMRLRGRSVTVSAGGQTASGYVNFN